MKKLARRLLASATSPTLLAATMMLAGMDARAQCPATELISGLQIPLGITQSNQGNLLVGETGTPEPNTGRISIVDPDGNRRTLLDGLPSGINDVLEPSGPAGVFVRGRTIYIASGIGDSLLPGPVPGTALGNPNPSSPIFSSVLAVHLSANAEKITEGFTLSLDEHEALADGETVNLSNGGGDKARIEMIANFPDFIPNPLPFFAENVRGSNPFDLVAVANQLFVTDGGRNLVWRVDMHSGAFSALAAFPPITNPLFPIGPPVTEAVPTGIRYSDGQLLVTLFRGAPFPPGTSQVQAIDPDTGSQTPFITGLKTAIDVLPIRDGGDTDWLVLQHASTGPFFGSPGLLLRFETPDSSPAVVAGGTVDSTFCLTRPTSMTLDQKTGTLYVTELGGRIVAIPIGP
jgi:hypothetical protein